MSHAPAARPAFGLVAGWYRRNVISYVVFAPADEVYVDVRCSAVIDKTRPGPPVATQDYNQGSARTIDQRCHEGPHSEFVSGTRSRLAIGMAVPHPDKGCQSSAPLPVVGKKIFDTFDAMIEVDR